MTRAGFVAGVHGVEFVDDVRGDTGFGKRRRGKGERGWRREEGEGLGFPWRGGKRLKKERGKEEGGAGGGG